MTYHTSALHWRHYGGLHHRRETLVWPIFSAGPAGFSATTSTQQSITGRTTTFTRQRIGRSLLRRLDEPKLDHPKPTLVGPELDQQQLRSSPKVAQHDFQEPDTARCFDLSGPIPTRAHNLRRPDTARCPGCNDPTTHRARDFCPARLELGRVISAWALLHTAVQRDFSIVSAAAARLRLGLVIFAARLWRIISARTLLRTAVTRDFSIHCIISSSNPTRARDFCRSTRAHHFSTDTATHSSNA